jgi:glycerol-1-phosphate dehydrogenase [NAD(P)+]
MSAALLHRLLVGTLSDPETGEPVSVPTRIVAIEPTLRGAEAALVQRLDLGRRLAVVADPTTWAVLGARVVAALEGEFAVDPILLRHQPHADLETALFVRARSAAADGLIAVGSGTVSDLVKYASYLDRKPYACFATAPSMNGYTSTNAAIMDGGVKRSLAAGAARGVFLDVDVLRQAPQRMIAAGFGDSICRPTAQADWLLAHHLLDQSYRALPFLLLAEDETALLADPQGLVAGEAGAITLLARTLVMSGFGMTICGGSYPASQGEHLIAHLMEMRADPAATPRFHGEQIAVTTLTMARIQAEMLARDRPRVQPSTLTEADLVAFHGAEVAKACWPSVAQKALDRGRAADVNARLERRWPEIRQAIGEIHRPAARLAGALSQAGAPTTASAIGMQPADYREIVLHAREIRDRFTFLDFAAESGGIPAEALA